VGIVVVKAGGELLERPDGVVQAVRSGWEAGDAVVLVHGGGPQLDCAAAAAGLASTRVAGRRITTPEVLDLAVAVWRGTVSMGWVRELAAAGVPAVGLCGVDGGWLRARRRPPVTVVDDDGVTRQVDYGEVGDVVAVDPGLLQALCGRAVPVIAPLATDGWGGVLNVNADTVAAAVAGALRATELRLLTSAPGLLRDPADPGSVVEALDLGGLDELEATGAVRSGMRPKVAAVRHALRSGVDQVWIGATLMRHGPGASGDARPLPPAPAH